MPKERPSSYKQYLFKNQNIPRSTIFSSQQQRSSTNSNEKREKVLNELKSNTVAPISDSSDDDTFIDSTSRYETKNSLPTRNLTSTERKTQMEFEEVSCSSTKHRRRNSLDEGSTLKSAEFGQTQEAITSTLLHSLVEDMDSPDEHLKMKNIPNEDGNVYSQGLGLLANFPDFSNGTFFEVDTPTYGNTPFHKLHKLMDSEEFNKVVDEPVNKTMGEILMMLLKYSIRFSMSQTAITCLFQLMNSMFASPILPESRYLIDSLFNPSGNATYHGMCPDCGSYVGVFERSCKTIKCNFCNVDIDVRKSSYDDFFVYFDTSSQISELISENSDYYNHIMHDRTYDKNMYKDIYDGKMYRAFLNTLAPEDRHQYLTVIFNTDGAPLYESSTYSIWPIYLQINEVPPKVRTTDMIVVGLWFGKNKPDMNVFLDPFVKDMNSLSEKGVKCNINGNDIDVKIYSLVCCVDSVARAPMQGVMQFNGKYGCNWCLHPGKWIINDQKVNSGSHKYPILDTAVARRNVEDTLKQMKIATPSKPCFGVKNASQLVNLQKFNIVEGFVPDHLHICSGIGKQFAKIWFGTKKESSSVISKQEQEEIHSIMSKIKVPCQIGRLARSITDKEFWKAREWENWILYYSTPILTRYLNRKFVLHWLLLVEALFILLKTEISIQEIDHADVLLHKFVFETQKLYSATAMTYNVHLLLHLARSVLNWGPLTAHSAYGFESSNGELLKIIHAAKGVHQQVARHISLNFSLILIKRKVYPVSSKQTQNFYDGLSNTNIQKTLKLSKPRYFGTTSNVSSIWIQNLQLSDRATCFSKMIKDGCLYLTSEKINKRSENCFIRLLNGSFWKIVKFIVDRETKKEYVLLNVIRTENPFKNQHKNLQKILRVEEDVVAAPTNEIEKICVCIRVGTEEFICAVPNLLSY